MISTKKEQGITLFAISLLLGSAILSLVTGLRGDDLTVFGFSNGFALLAGIEVVAAVSLWVNGPISLLGSK